MPVATERADREFQFLMTHSHAGAHQYPEFRHIAVVGNSGTAHVE
jgi:hypothetical protein